MTALPFLQGVRFLAYWGPVLRVAYPNGPTIEVGFAPPSPWGTRAAYVFDHLDPEFPPREAMDEVEFRAREIACAEYAAAECGTSWTTAATDPEIVSLESAARTALRQHFTARTEEAA